MTIFGRKTRHMPLFRNLFLIGVAVGLFSNGRWIVGLGVLVCALTMQGTDYT